MHLVNRKHTSSAGVKAILLFFIFVIIFPPAFNGYAQNDEESLPAQPAPIPLFLAVSHSGQISATSGVMGLPIPKGSMRQSLPDSALNALGRSLLIVRLNGTETIFDLNDHPISEIEFQRGYYRADRLYTSAGRTILEASRVASLVETPIASLSNDTKVKIKTGRMSCFETSFPNNMYGIVVQPVRMREQPFVPWNLDRNWSGSLRQAERVFVLLHYCNAGSWLRIQRESGTLGWAKEWGLTEKLIERTFIIPEAQYKKKKAKP